MKADRVVNPLENFDMNKLATLASTTTAVLSLLAGSALADHDEWPTRSTPTLEGSWQVETTLRADGPDCTIAPIVGTGVNPFQAFNTFHEGGTVSEFGTRSPPAMRTSGHGVWERRGHRTYGYRVLFHSFDASGLFTATMDMRTGVKLGADGNTFAGVSRFLRTDISGNVLRFCATMSGKRITLG
jgi:hypothetical protein